MRRLHPGFNSGIIGGAPLSVTLGRSNTPWIPMLLKSKERHRHSDLVPSVFIACKRRALSAFTSQRYAILCRKVILVGGGSIFRQAQAFTSPTVMVGGISPSLCLMR